MKKQMRAVAFGLAVGSVCFGSGVASAADGYRLESVGVDAHYESRENDVDIWSGSIQYARVVVSNFEVGVAYTFAGSDPGDGTTQGLQLIGRQWFGPYPKANTITPFVELAAGLELAHGKYENTLAGGAGVGMFVSDQSELRLTLKHAWGGFEDVTRLDAGFFYHF
jgi:hypothetical protein